MNSGTELGFEWGTPAAPARAADLQQLRLHVSLNEEHVYLSLALHGERQLDLGERSHHYCLLTLARQLDKPEYVKHARGTIESVAAILESSPTATPLMATAVPRLLEARE